MDMRFFPKDSTYRLRLIPRKTSSARLRGLLFIVQAAAAVMAWRARRIGPDRCIHPAPVDIEARSPRRLGDPSRVVLPQLRQGQSGCEASSSRPATAIPFTKLSGCQVEAEALMCWEPPTTMFTTALSNQTVSSAVLREIGMTKSPKTLVTLDKSCARSSIG